MLRNRRTLATVPWLLSALLLVPSPIAAQETGADTGDVTVRMTVRGPVDGRDVFLVVLDCGDTWCADETTDPAMADGKIVAFCGPRLIDIPVCETKSYEFTVELATGPMAYSFYRIRQETPAGETGEPELLHSGTWTIHSGSQTIFMEYVYPGAAPALPDTALPAP